MPKTLSYNIPSRLFIFLLAIAMISGCSAYEASQHPSDKSPSIGHQFALEEEIAPLARIQSIELHPPSKPLAPPIIGLNDARQLLLEFDDLSTQSRQFTVEISHRNRDWSKSSLVPNDYINGFFKTHFSSGNQSFAQNPPYRHYQYNFPNDQLQITKSGNYLLTVSDFQSRETIFRQPFFVTENAGALQTRIESLFAQRQDGRTLAQPFSKYRYPNFVHQPQFDLAFTYVQNRFWGRRKSTDLFDTATPGQVHFHLQREEAFIGDLGFYVLDVRSFQPDGRQIVDLQPGHTPPIVTLRRDIQQFKPVATRFPGAVLGIPKDRRRAEYGTIDFRLETTATIQPNDRIYIMGDFNNWIIDPRFRMQYDSTAHLWNGRGVIKQGLYSYKYVRIRGGQLDDLAIDRKFTNGKQEYLTFVYFRDPQYHYDRLLKVDRTVSRSH